MQSRDLTKVSRHKRHASGLLPQLASLAVPEAEAPLLLDPRADLSVEHRCHPEIRVHHDAPAARPCYGLAGMRDHDGTLSFWPRRAPEDNAILRFPVTYRGQLLEIEISLDKVQYTLREGERLVIRHETEEVELTREKAQALRPVSRR
jgi:Glycosyl hydrolase family 65, C-terminal domain